MTAALEAFAGKAGPVQRKVTPLNGVAMRAWMLAVGMLLTGAVGTAAAAARSDTVETPELAATLLAEADDVAAGAGVALGVLLEHAPHWHSYWQNAGDAGLTTRVRAELPDGVSLGPIEWPHPERYELAGIQNYGYEGRVLLPMTLSVSAAYAADTVPVRLTVDWLACKEECIPGRAELAIELPVGGGGPVVAAHADDFAAARARQPVPGPEGARYELVEGELRVSIPLPEGFDAEAGWDLFPVPVEVLSNTPPAGRAVVDGQVLWPAAQSEYFKAAPAVLELVLVNGKPPSSRAWRVMAAGAGSAVTAGAPGAVPAAASPALLPAPAGDTLGLGLALLFALLGGVILNLMPCVFPVLTLKALALRGDAHGARHGLLYAAGCVAAFLALAGVLLALRAGGEALGWGFQLQSPWLVGALVYLFVAMGLSLSGLFTIGERWMGVGQELAGGEGDRAAFFTGVLAAVVASPCTAPFMGAAMGYALTQSPAVALAVFGALGLGLALPFVLVSMVPGLARHLPRPGPWMDRLKQLLAFPLYLSALWLAWVFGEQQGALAMAWLLAGAVSIAFVLWLLALPPPSGVVRKAGIALGVLAALWVLQDGARREAAPLTGAMTAGHEAWSEERLAALAAEGRPVLVNMTAAWCITCLANERVALSGERFRNMLAERGIVYLKGDWTRRDEAITRYLAQFGRTGVPLYVWYPGDGASPVVLPQLLTEAVVIDALGTPSNQP
jgi:thiol:disulfide interchange protein DsbD